MDFYCAFQFCYLDLRFLFGRCLKIRVRNKKLIGHTMYFDHVTYAF